MTAALFFAAPIHGHAQDLAQLDKQAPLKIKGSLSAMVSGYRVAGIDPRQQPLYWTLSGSPTLSIYGVDIPFFLLLSNQERRFQQPFNQIGIAPHYKWARAYLGYNHITFSQYTLAGRRFLGTGVELTPGPLRLGVIYGKFQRAIREDSVFSTPANPFLSNVPLPAFDRRGIAVKLGIGTEENFLDFLALKAEDDREALSLESTRPQENLALGIRSRISLFQRVTWETDGAISAFTRDQGAVGLPLPAARWAKVVESVFPPNLSSQFRTAFHSNLAYQGKILGLKLGYKRIDKDYRSMGAYFFLTDVAEWTIAPSLNLASSRLRIQGSVGRQRDNLAGLQANTTSRFIGSGNLSFYPNQVFGIDIRYANYGLSQNPIQRNIADTTLLEQVTQSFTFLPRLTFQRDRTIQTWIGMLGYHALSDQSESIVYEAEMQTWFGFLQYQMNLRESGWNFQASANGQRVTLPQGQTESLGGTLGLSRSMAKGKLSVQASASLFRNWLQKNPNGLTSTYQASLNWRMHKQHSMQFRVRHLINEAPLGGPVPDFNESQGSVAYVFSFQ